MLGIWEDEEVKALFAAVEECKTKNKPIAEAFALHAQKFARKPNSVRNYYYHEIANLSADRERCCRLSIDLSRHEKASIAYFSQEEEKSLIEKIDAMVASGLSVRKACFKLAEGDALKMLRFQNKYRNHAAKGKQKVVKAEGNVIAFKKPVKGLSDSEVQSLFLGLVRLVKKNAAIEGEERAKEKIKQANEKLRKALVDIQLQSREIEKMKERYSQLKRENNTLARKLLHVRCDKAGLLREKLSVQTGQKENQIEKL
ncbi:MAG: hypothetical protein J6A28_04055 [Clostridia bacterium]|nr:hypothetical protein [Clostridia bacterium]